MGQMGLWDELVSAVRSRDTTSDRRDTAAGAPNQSGERRPVWHKLAVETTGLAVESTGLAVETTGLAVETTRSEPRTTLPRPASFTERSLEEAN